MLPKQENERQQKHKHGFFLFHSISFNSAGRAGAQASGGHQNAEQHQQAAANSVYYPVMFFDPLESGLQIINQHRADQERYAQPME